MLFLSKLLLRPKSRLVFAISTGIALVSASPYFGLGFYAWIGLVPLFFLIKTATTYRQALIEGLVFLLSYNFCFFIWILGVHPLTWLHISNTESLFVTFAIWFFTATFHSIVLIPAILLAKFFCKKKEGDLSIMHAVLISAAWVLTTHTLILNLEPNIASIAIPLNQIVYSQYQYKELIQICNVIGAIGFEFILVFVNLLALNIFISENKAGKYNRFKYPAIILFILIAIFSYGTMEIIDNQQKRIANNHKRKTFTIIQANYSLASKEVHLDKPINSINLQYELSKQINQRQDFLFWAEGSVRMVNKAILQRTIFRELSSRANVFVYGTSMLLLDHAYNVIDFMEYKFTGQMATGFNLQHYYKSRLMPFGEYTPFYNFLPASLKQVSDRTIGKNYIPSSPNKPILVNNVKVASGLCSELMFPQIIRNQVREGAELILNLNDLSWFKSPLNIFKTTVQRSKDQLGEDMAKKLFFAVAVFRAIENKRDLLLVSNTGYSGLINPSGETIILSGTNRTAILQNSFLPSTEKSIYSFYSW